MGYAGVADLGKTSWEHVEEEVVLPSQFFDMLRRSTEIMPEKRLALAVLEDAVNEIWKPHRRRKPGQPNRWRSTLSARAWLEAEDYRHVFSFVNVCELFSINPRWLRDGILNKAGAGRRISSRSRRYRAIVNRAVA